MSPVDPRTLKPGQRVRWTRTVEGTVRADHVTDVEIQTADGDGHSIVVGRAGAVDTFELLAPDLPTEPGSTIVARLVGWTFPRVLARGLKNGQPAWFVAGASECTDTVDPKDITEWALLDGVHTVRDAGGGWGPRQFEIYTEPEPPCPFTDEHQRWASLTDYGPGDHADQDGILGILVDCSRCGPGRLLLDPDEEQPGSAPEAERPVPPKGLGAVIKARVLGESYDSTLVRAVTGDQNCWHSLASSGATWWFSDDQVTVTEVLHSGIEVPR